MTTNTENTEGAKPQSVEDAAKGLTKETKKQRAARLKKEKKEREAAADGADKAPPVKKRYATQRIIDLNPDNNYELGQEIDINDVVEWPENRKVTQADVEGYPLLGLQVGEPMPTTTTIAGSETPVNLAWWDEELAEQMGYMDAAAEDEDEDESEEDEPINNFSVDEFTEEMLEQAVTRPDVVAVARRIVERADEIAGELGAHIKEEMSPEAKEAMIHESLVRTHGADYVRAVRVRDGAKTIFKRDQWEKLPPKKNGWKEETPTPPEVKAAE